MYELRKQINKDHKIHGTLMALIFTIIEIYLYEEVFALEYSESVGKRIHFGRILVYYPIPFDQSCRQL